MRSAFIILLCFLFCSAFAFGYVPVPIYDYVDVPVSVFSETFMPAKCSDIFNDTLMSVQKSCNKEYTKYEYLRTDVRKDIIRTVGFSLEKENFYTTNFNIVNNEVHVWSVPVGQRDFRIFPECRAYEIKKGVCRVLR